MSLTGPAAPPSADRAQLLQSAVSFLRDPSTASSPLAQRIAFLESKGLSQPEIEQALQQAGPAPPGPGASGYPGPTSSLTRYAGGPGARAGMYGPGAMVAEYQRDWRDWFIMGVVGGGIGWLTVKLAQKFLVPHLQPPSETDLEASQRALEAKYDEAAALLRTLQESTDAVAQSLDVQKADVEKELDEVRRAVSEMREGEKKRDEWAKNVGRQVDDMVKSLPSLLDKQASAQTSSLADLQTELKSLKSLLIARRPPATTSTSTGALPSSPSSSTPAPSTATPAPTAPAAPPASHSTLPFNIRPPGLPAWQLKSSNSSSTSSGVAGAAASPSASGTATPAAGSAAGGYAVPGSVAGGEGEKDPSASGVLVEKPVEEGETDAGAAEDGRGKGKDKAVEA
ncbi:Pex14p [Rhodotorula paludigena]|uniref:Pex14p n=1 Tax=Rhodotorula paludigena TaxID=86838 RepID=UPI00317E304D